MTRVVQVDAVVIGGGVVGLSIARALSFAGREVILFEAERRVGLHASSRNSEVIHAGIYYEPGSLKARACVAGRDQLYAYCEQHAINHRRLGKLIAATTDAEIAALEQLEQRALANGVRDLRWLDRGEITSLEPELSAVRALFSPSTGIIDSRAYLTALRGDAESAGATVLVSAPVLSGHVSKQGHTLEVGGQHSATVACETLINAAGLRAPEVARSLVGMPEALVPGQFFAKGHYFVLRGRAPFRHLVYPVPVPGGLGTHFTLDLASGARFGPDVYWQDSLDYRFESQREAAFYAAIRRYFPGLAAGSLAPGYTGIRAKLGPAASGAHDFVLQGPRVHGVPGLLHLFGIESPGLTASLALAELALAELNAG